MIADPERFQGRLGLTVPHEWWASAPLLKSFEAAGFAWVQIDAPPPPVLAAAGQAARHARALAASLGTTGLRAILHSPPALRLGTREGDAAAEGLLSYAVEAGIEHVVYHALALPDAPESAEALRLESRSLGRAARRVERLGLTLSLENLAPLYPGPEPLSANPLSLRGLVNRIGSDRVGICLDLGHAHLVADCRHTSMRRLIEPVSDMVSLFHVHDNLGSRRTPHGAGGGLDPLRLDLHLAPGRGTVPWADVVRVLERKPAAPVVMEVHPPRPAASKLVDGMLRMVSPRTELAAAR